MGYSVIWEIPLASIKRVSLLSAPVQAISPPLAVWYSAHAVTVTTGGVSQGCSSVTTHGDALGLGDALALGDG
jgi:hypothetical protein